MNKRGLLFIISGPAGSGKGTIVSRVRELAPFDFSVSATTRNPRPGEVDGVHYHFLTKEQFEEYKLSYEQIVNRQFERMEEDEDYDMLSDSSDSDKLDEILQLILAEE
jgi:guanylate kinase